MTREPWPARWRGRARLVRSVLVLLMTVLMAATLLVLSAR